MRVLFSSHLRELVEQAQALHGFTCEAIAGPVLMAAAASPAAVLVLHMAPAIAARAVRALRAGLALNPIMVVMDHSDLTATVHAFRAGADDVQCLPLTAGELAARVAALARRTRSPDGITFAGDCLFCIDTRTLSSPRGVTHLDRKPADLLWFIMHRGADGKVVTKMDCMTFLYEGKAEPSVRILAVFMCGIRRALERVTDAEVVSTVWGRGYAFWPDGARQPRR